MRQGYSRQKFPLIGGTSSNSGKLECRGGDGVWQRLPGDKLDNVPCARPRGFFPSPWELHASTQGF